MGNFWLKLYFEIIDDPKVMTLSDDAQLLFFKSLCLAGKEDKKGHLPPIQLVSFSLRKSEEELETLFKELEKSGLAVKNGTWKLTNFEKRQSAMKPSDKMKRKRDQEHRNEYKDWIK